MQKRWIWPFELEEKIGEGGMGVVYRARYVVDDRRLAVKLLPPDVANTTILSRFEREMEILKTLRHPHIVRAFGGVCEGDQRFYAMELVEGGTLDRVIEEKGRLPWELVIEYGVQMASALSYAHERGVVHRDVKPGNFLLTTAGKLKLSDFGLATVVAASKITAAGRTMGTFPYMAPEQIRGRPPISAQSDLYALGCVLFEMLAGRPPFIGETPAEVMHKHLQDVPPRVVEFEPGCPAMLDQLINDLLAKEPEQRPESAYVVARRLNEVTPELHVTFPPPPAERTMTEREQAETPLAGMPAQRTVPKPSSVEQGWLLPFLIGAVLLMFAWMAWTWLRPAAANRAEELWVQAFRGANPSLTAEASKVLTELGETSPTAVKALIEGLEDKRPFIREESARALGKIGAQAQSATTSLGRVQKNDESGEVRYEAGKALELIRAARDERSYLSVYFGIGFTVLVLSGLFALSRRR
ncbi:MAG: protein kinase [Planctomycetaceae bacterium]